MKSFLSIDQITAEIKLHLTCIEEAKIFASTVFTWVQINQKHANIFIYIHIYLPSAGKYQFFFKNFSIIFKNSPNYTDLFSLLIQATNLLAQ